MECDHRATSKNDLTQHQHEGKYPWNMTTRLQQKVMLHQQSLHEGNKYECRECDHQATS